MKIKASGLIGFIGLTGLILPAGFVNSAAGQTGSGSSAADVVEANQAGRASVLISSQIKDYGGKKAGSVQDMAVDLANGRLVEVVVSQEDFWGRKALAGVPPQSFLLAGDGKTLFCSADKAKLAGAPEVELARWNDSVTQSQVENVYRYFGLLPYSIMPEHPSGDADRRVVPSLNNVQRASELMGLAVVNQRGENLGKVADVVTDLPRGRVAEVIIGTGDFMGLPGELSAVPPQVLHYNADSTLALATSKEGLLQSPHFPKAAWPELNRSQIIAVDQAYHVTPYLMPLGPNTATAGGENRGETTVSQQIAGQTPSDIEITIKIREDLRTDESLIAVIPNVKIVTVKGEVTLSGWVNTVQQKIRVGGIAARTVPFNQVKSITIRYKK